MISAIMNRVIAISSGMKVTFLWFLAAFLFIFLFFYHIQVMQTKQLQN